MRTGVDLWHWKLHRRAYQYLDIISGDVAQYACISARGRQGRDTTWGRRKFRTVEGERKIETGHDTIGFKCKGNRRSFTRRDRIRPHDYVRR
jgi:hypothetical protein